MSPTFNYTKDIYTILRYAQDEALQKKSSSVMPEDIFIGLLLLENDLMSLLLKELKISANDTIAEIRKKTASSGLSKFLNKEEASAESELPFDGSAKVYFDTIHKVCAELEDEIIGPEHLFLAYAKEQEKNQTIAKIFQRQEITYEKAKTALIKIAKKAGSKTPTLDKFGNDLTQKAKNGKLDPVIGRFAEIEQIVQILSRRRKNNPVIFGDPGVGKTAIVEGLAARIASGEVPENLKNKRIIELSMNSLIAGASRRGEYEERLQKIIEETASSQGKVILFIDEIHTIIKGSENDDAANILKPALSRGEIQAIGATTVTEYHQYFEKDPAFERRFQPVLITEPNDENCFFILKGIRSKYENFHNIKIPDDALFTAIDLSKRYITNRFLPDKAIDLIDEACSLSKTPRISASGEITALEHARQFHMEKFHQSEKSGNSVRTNQEIGIIEDIDRQISNLKNELDEAENKEILQESALKKVTARLSNIPLHFLNQKEDERLIHCTEALKQRIIGQDHAISAIVSALMRNMSGLKRKDRPIGSFIFMGPTGVGKTELVESLARQLFGSKEALIRFDMSEYAEKHAAAKLIGAPPGYIGYEEGGQLTEAVRIRPYSIILFDEIEKGHPEIFDLLLQILDEGHLTDNQGHQVNFKHTLIVCTSNIGQETLDSETLNTLNKSDQKKQLVHALKDFLRLEIINRFDDLIFFNSLNLEQLGHITKLLLQETEKALAERNISLKISDNAINALAQLGYDPKLGARPLKYTIQEEIETPLAEMIARGQIINNQAISIDYYDNHFSIKEI